MRDSNKIYHQIFSPSRRPSFWEVAFVHGQEAVIIDGEFVSKFVSHSIDVSILTSQSDELAGVKDLEVEILALEHLKKEAVFIEFLAELLWVGEYLDVLHQHFREELLPWLGCEEVRLERWQSDHVLLGLVGDSGLVELLNRGAVVEVEEAEVPRLDLSAALVHVNVALDVPEPLKGLHEEHVLLDEDAAVLVEDVEDDQSLL